ncbi:hypothetical protein PIB30_041477 [Stylosanthes scabra]|uniref:Uncharacterized protein n=1 Tax=Stylosanthes scabra TaxID=79078 RepID=A0ABU6RFM2_9FABA|nr:hypothetical protein [Stylosanthes scabra]
MSLKYPSIPRYKLGIGVNRAKPLSIYDEEDIQQSLKQRNTPVESENDEELDKIILLKKAAKGESDNIEEGDRDMREEDSIQNYEAEFEGRASKEQPRDEGMAIQVKEEEQGNLIPGNQSLEDEYEMMRFRARLAILKGKKNKKDEEENNWSFSMEQEIKEDKLLGNQKLKLYEKAIGDILKKFQGLNQQQLSKGITNIEKEGGQGEQRKLKKEKRKTKEANFVYGDPDPNKRKKQWESMTASMGNLENPRSLIEYFNDILTQEENRRAFPLAILKSLPAISSDLCHMVLELEPKDSKSREFKYEAFGMNM